MWMNELVKEWENLGEEDWKILSGSLLNSQVETSSRSLPVWLNEIRYIQWLISCLLLSNDYSISITILFLSPLHPLLTTLRWTFSKTVILSSVALRVCGWGEGGEGRGCSPTLPFRAAQSPLSHKWTLMQISCFLDRLSFLCWVLIPICVQEL